MKKSCFAIFIALWSSGSFGESTHKEEFDRNVAEVRACVAGFSVAIKLFGQTQFKGKNNDEVLNIVKAACTTDKLVAAIYSAQRNSKDVKSLNEVRLFAEGLVSGWYIKEVEALNEAEKKLSN